MKQFIMGHNNTSYHPIKIDVIEEEYKAKFIGDFALKTKDGGWSDFPIAIFYTPNPDTEKGHSHYFGVWASNKTSIHPTPSIYITNGESAFSQPIVGVIADNGEIIFSRFRHDYHTSQDGSAWIDGGREYVRTNKPDTLVQLIIVDDHLEIKQTKLPVRK